MSSIGDLRSPEGRRALRVTVVYVIAGALWIVFSDRLLGAFVRDPIRLTELQTLKGWLFVLGSGLLIFVLVRSAMASLSRSKSDLRKTEELLEQVAEHTGAVIFSHTPDFGETLWATPSAEQVWGLPLAEMFRRPTFFLDMVHPEDRRRVEGAVETGRPGLEYRIVRGDGEVRWLRTLTSPIRDEEGLVERVMGITEDVTDRRRHDEELLFLAAAMQQASEGVVIADVSGSIVYVNPAFEAMTGYARADAIGNNARILRSDKQESGFYRDMWSTLLDGRPWQARFVARRRDDSEITLDGAITPVRSGGDEITHMVAVLRDATHEMELEKQVRHGQKMEAMGRFAGGIAHDFNNLLTAIKGHAQFALEDLEGSDSLRDDILEVLKASDRAHNLTSQLLAFSRQQVTEPRVVEVGEVIRTAEKVLRRLIGADVELTVDLTPGLGRVRVDPAQLDQLLFNLVINARDAMPSGGRLTIRAENVEVREDLTQPSAEVALTPGPYVRLHVVDTGIGIDAATREKIFEPFFTTKPPGRGTGLGLSTVFGFVEQSGGQIRVASEAGAGATFEIDLPRTDAVAEDGPTEVAASAPLTGFDTILVVEDQPSVRSVVRRALERAGYLVHEAANGPEALEIWERKAGAIDMVITDLVMPHMGGRALTARMFEHAPPVPILFMSGYAEGDSLQRGAIEPGMHLLEKPFDAPELLRKVRSVMEFGATGRRREGPPRAG
jgi:PAS domain S-box-containing protein